MSTSGPGPDGADERSFAARLAGPLACAIEASARCLQAIGLYGREHPSSSRALADAAAAFASTDFSRPIITAIFPDRMTIGDAALPEGDGLRTIARILIKADIAALQWLSAPTPAQVSALLDWWMSLDRGPAARTGQPDEVSSWVR